MKQKGSKYKKSSFEYTEVAQPLCTALNVCLNE